MSRRLFIASFESENDILGITRELRRRGYCIDDVFTPYPVHGLPEAMGLRRSRLPWVCFICGAVGAAIALYFQYSLSTISWPINVGGKPWNSWPAFIPITFELTVLCAGLGTVAALLLRHRILPGSRPRLVDPLITDSRFVLVLVEQDAAFDPWEVAAVCADFNALEIDERMENEFLTADSAGEAA